MALPKTFTSGERLFAGDLNDNFEALDSAIASTAANAAVATNLTSGTVNSNLMPSGSVIQMGFATLSSDHVSTSSSVADTGLSITFTPKRATSKLVIQCTAFSRLDSLGFEAQSVTYYVDRDNTDILAVAKFFEDDDDAGANRIEMPLTFTCVADSNAASATTIKLQVAGQAGRSVTTKTNSIFVIYEIA